METSERNRRLRAAILLRETTMSTATARIGIDIGNATCTATNGERSVFFPSIYATTRRGYVGVGTTASDRHHIAYNGTQYVIGAGALELPAYDSLLNEALPKDRIYERYLADQSFAALLAGVSALYPDTQHLDITLGSGAPLSVYEPHGAAIAARYKGQHEYGYMGRPRTLTIRDAAIFGEGLEVMRLLTPDQIAGKVALHDIGGGTWGEALYFNGEMLRRKAYNAGIDLLMGDITAISGDTGARWAIQSEMRRNPKSHATIRKAIEQAIIDTLKVIEGKYPLTQADRHVVCGGGAFYAANIIKARYGKPVIVVNKEAPEAANAMAYLKAIEVL